MWVYKPDYLHDKTKLYKPENYKKGYAVGFVDAAGVQDLDRNWHPVGFTAVEWYPSADIAGKRCHYLNGGRYFTGAGEPY